MGLSIDFTDVPSNSTVPAGTYNAVVFGIELKPNKAGDSMNLNWQFKIQGGEHDGRSLFSIMSLKKEALWKLKQTLKNIAPDIDTNSVADLDTDTLCGRPCRIVVTIQQWEGEDRNNIKNILAPEKTTDALADLPFNM